MPEPGACYVMDRGYIHFARLYRLTLSAAFFVVRARKNMQCRRRYSHRVDKTTGLRSDQTIVLTGHDSAHDYPAPARLICYWDEQQNLRLRFLTNNFLLPALTIAQLYKRRWDVELFFKWIKQHLRIKKFYGTSANAVKTQIWVAVIGYLILYVSGVTSSTEFPFTVDLDPDRFGGEAYALKLAPDGSEIIYSARLHRKWTDTHSQPPVSALAVDDSGALYIRVRP